MGVVGGTKRNTVPFIIGEFPASLTTSLELAGASDGIILRHSSGGILKLELVHRDHVSTCGPRSTKPTYSLCPTSFRDSVGLYGGGGLSARAIRDSLGSGARHYWLERPGHAS